MSVVEYIRYVISHDLMISTVKTMYLGVGVHPYPHIRIGFIGLPKRCAMIALSIYKFMLTNSLTNNLYGLPYRPYTPGSDLA